MNTSDKWTAKESPGTTADDFPAADDPLGLSALPQPEAGPDDWPVIAITLQQDQFEARRRRMLGGWLAVAASVLVVVGIVRHQGPDQDLSSTSVATNDTGITSSLQDTTLASLIGLSQKVEREVLGLRREVGTVPSETLIYLAELEDMVIQLDGELAIQPDSLDLWGQRVNLMLDLAALYRHEIQRDYQRMASL
jgi:hypothetical protein